MKYDPQIMTDTFSYIKRYPESYVYSCPTEGECAKEFCQQYYVPTKQQVGVYSVNNKAPYTNFHFIYNVCYGCHLPINTKEAVRLNLFLDRKMPEVNMDDVDDLLTDMEGMLSEG